MLRRQGIFFVVKEVTLTALCILHYQHGTQTGINGTSFVLSRIRSTDIDCHKRYNMNHKLTTFIFIFVFFIVRVDCMARLEAMEKLRSPVEFICSKQVVCCQFNGRIEPMDDCLCLKKEGKIVPNISPHDCFQGPQK